ncbi:unnamed protein product [Orchesella dallaii]|uniref:Uncharacterized protein n=1 Tax=Orchesella dallaii TaxID=48710 RepID=A0ABP1RM13_9HEXA
MMLQFILYRFYLVEIVVGTNWNVAVTSLGRLQACTHCVGNWVLLQFTSKETGIGGKCSEFKTFLNVVDSVRFGKSILIKGIHFRFDISDEIKEYFVKNEKEIESQIVETETLISLGRDLNYRMGIVSNLSTCMQIVRRYIHLKPTNSRISEFLKRIDYLICEETLSMEINYNIKDIMEFFDTHLYLNQFFMKFQPHLELSFRFGSAYNISYLPIQAFDSESMSKQGWWAIKNYSDLSSALSYEERYAAHTASNMFRPFPLIPVPTFNTPQGGTKTVAALSTNLYLVGLAVVVLVLLFCGLCLQYRKRKIRSSNKISLHNLQLRTLHQFFGSQCSVLTYI